MIITLEEGTMAAIDAHAFLCKKDRPEARLRLSCFTFAASSASLLTDVARTLEADAET
jgi:hypothetical protein